MSDHLTGESGEEGIDESGRNETQQRLDEEGPPEAPVDAEWEPGWRSDDAEDDEAAGIA